METGLDKHEDIINGFKNKFSEERSKWTKKIKSMGSKLSRLEKMIELQTEVYSERQVIVEYNHELLATLSSLNSILKKKKKEKFINYSTNYDIMLKSPEKTIMIEGDLSNLMERIDILENQIKFYDKTLKSIDNIVYGIKNRIELEEFRRK